MSLRWNSLRMGSTSAAGHVTIIEIQNVDGEENDDGEPECVLLCFLRQGASMLAHRKGPWCLKRSEDLAH